MSVDRATNILVGARLRELRRLRELPVSVVADQLFVTKNTISSWERGDRTVSVVEFCAYCRLLDIEPGVVLDGLVAS